MKDLRQTDPYAKYIESIGWKLSQLGNTYVYSKKLPLIGSVVKLQRPNELVPVRSLTKLAKEQRAYSVTIEPQDKKQYEYYKSQFFKPISTPSLPSKTIILDLSRSEKTLLSEMHHKTRYNIGLAKRRGVVVKKGKNIGEFSNFWQARAKKRGMFLPVKREIIQIYKAFKGKRQLFSAYFEGKLVAELLLLIGDGRSYYMYTASNKLGNKNFAPTLTTWEAIRNSKERKVKYFDFEGIYDERFPLDTWKGFTRYKKSFGGKEVMHPGPLRRLFLPV